MVNFNMLAFSSHICHLSPLWVLLSGAELASLTPNTGATFHGRGKSLRRSQVPWGVPVGKDLGSASTGSRVTMPRAALLWAGQMQLRPAQGRPQTLQEPHAALQGHLVDEEHSCFTHEHWPQDDPKEAAHSGFPGEGLALR